MRSPAQWRRLVLEHLTDEGMTINQLRVAIVRATAIPVTYLTLVRTVDQLVLRGEARLVRGSSPPLFKRCRR